MKWITDKNHCDLCSASNLIFAYRVPDSNFGVEIFVCNNCALVQSKRPFEVALPPLTVSTSCGANWGNLRHAKGIRIKKALPILETLPWERFHKILDLGANRGDFIQYMTEQHPNIPVIAVEPDARVVAPYRNLAQVALLLDRFENIQVPHQSVDFIYSSHTLEHADSARIMLQSSLDLLAPNGMMFLEIPNLAVLSYKANVQQVFIDKHNFHFHNEVLVSLLENSGCTILDNTVDMFNISLLIKKETSTVLGNPTANPKLSTRNLGWVQEYASQLQENHKKIKQVAVRIKDLISRQKVAFWGGEAIFDALIRIGGLEPRDVPCLIDQYLSEILDEVHGIPLHSPSHLKIFQPQIVIVLARSSAKEISAKIRHFGIKNVITFDDLLQ